MTSPTHEYKSGVELLAELLCTSREDKLAHVIIALMHELETIHREEKKQSLEENLYNPEVICYCADAYRMGHEALKR